MTMRYWNKERNHSKGLLTCILKNITFILGRTVLTATEEAHVIRAMEEIGLALTGWDSRHEASKTRWNICATRNKEMHYVINRK